MIKVYEVETVRGRFRFTEDTIELAKDHVNYTLPEFDLEPVGEVRFYGAFGSQKEVADLLGLNKN